MKLNLTSAGWLALALLVTAFAPSSASAKMTNSKHAIVVSSTANLNARMAAPIVPAAVQKAPAAKKAEPAPVASIQFAATAPASNNGLDILAVTTALPGSRTNAGGTYAYMYRNTSGSANARSHDGAGLNVADIDPHNSPGAIAPANNSGQLGVLT
jgi:hypothetical protein